MRAVMAAALEVATAVVGVTMEAVTREVEEKAAMGAMKRVVRVVVDLAEEEAMDSAEEAMDSEEAEKATVEVDSAAEEAMDSVEAAMDLEEVEKATEEVDSAVAMDLEEDTTSRHIRTQYR